MGGPGRWSGGCGVGLGVKVSVGTGVGVDVKVGPDVGTGVQVQVGVGRGVSTAIATGEGDSFAIEVPESTAETKSKSPVIAQRLAKVISAKTIITTKPSAK
jgi:hypothetical protein